MEGTIRSINTAFRRKKKKTIKQILHYWKEKSQELKNYTQIYQC